MQPAPEETTHETTHARIPWRWCGDERPVFALPPGSGQESVWDYPRPPRLVADGREVVVRWHGIEVARTRAAVRLLETSHPPSFYIPWTDVDRRLLVQANGGSYCEWKGRASYWSLVHAGQRLDAIAWSYPQPMRDAEAIADCVAFYCEGLDCSVDGQRAKPQPGGFYGGWITPELVGPFKGGAGSGGW
jgi:uncharacterized protein (DUF427 family)